MIGRSTPVRNAPTTFPPGRLVDEGEVGENLQDQALCSCNILLVGRSGTGARRNPGSGI